jgi:hypothetical protein
MAKPGRRRIASVLLGLWAAGVLLPFAQLVLGGEEQRSQADAARTAVQITGQTAISLARTAFVTNVLRDAGLAGAAPVARQYAALDGGAADAPAELAVARAEESAAPMIWRIANEMTRTPTTDRGVSAYTATALASGPDQWTAALKVQNSHAELAERFSTWSNSVVALIAVAAAISAVIEARAATPSTRERRRPTVNRRIRKNQQRGADVRNKQPPSTQPGRPDVAAADGGRPPDGRV